MKRMPLLVSFFVFILLCMSFSYWGMQVFKPKVRSVVAPSAATSFEPEVGQWGTVFGQNPVAQITASNYQLKGIVLANQQSDSAAIISKDGKPEQTMAVSRELSPGIVLKEVHDTYILIAESGITKRVDLPPMQTLPSAVLPAQTKKYGTPAINSVVPNLVPATPPLDASR